MFSLIDQWDMLGREAAQRVPVQCPCRGRTKGETLLLPPLPALACLWGNTVINCSEMSAAPLQTCCSPKRRRLTGMFALPYELHLGDSAFPVYLLFPKERSAPFSFCEAEAVIPTHAFKESAWGHRQAQGLRGLVLEVDRRGHSVEGAQQP